MSVKSDRRRPQTPVKETTMGTTKRWRVEIFLEEGADSVRAAARLDTSEDAHVHGDGRWERTDEDEMLRAGEQLAVAEALSEIATKLSLRAVGGTISLDAVTVL